MSFRSGKNDENILPFPGRRALDPAAAASLPVLIVLHQETSTPGRVGNALRALGFPLDIRRPRFGDPRQKLWTSMPARSSLAAR
jgi:GMP synthase (glutamine-hydrolysing)